MARDFDGSGDYIVNDGGVSGIDVPDRSVSFVVNVNAIPTWKAIINLNVDDTTNQLSLSAISPATSGWALELEIYTDGNDGVWKTGDLALNTEYSICVVYEGLNEPIVYVDGVDQGSLTVVTAVTGSQDTGMNSITLGANLARTNSLDGQLSEVAIWSRLLTDNEAILVTSGNSPNHVPDGLQHYWPLIDWSYDQVGNAHGTETGTTVTTHPTIVYRYPVVASAQATTGTTNAGSPYNMVVNMPANRPANENDLYVFHITRNSDTGNIEDPSGVTKILDIEGNPIEGAQGLGGSMRYYAGFAAALGTLPSSYTFTSDAAGGGSQEYYATVIRIAGVDLAKVYGRAITNRQANSTPVIADSISVATPDSLILRLYSIDTRHPDNVDSRDVSLYADSFDTYPNSIGHAGSMKYGPPEGPVGTRNADLDSVDDWTAMTIEIRSLSPVFPKSPPWENFNKVKLVQQQWFGDNVAGTSQAATFDNPTTPGNFLVTCLGGDKSMGTITKPDSSWSQTTPISQASVSAGMAYKEADGTEDTVTWTWSTSNTGAQVWIGEFSGIKRFLDFESAHCEPFGQDFIGIDPPEETVAFTDTKTRFTIVMHVVDTELSPTAMANLKFYPEMQVLSEPKGAVADCGMIIAVREDSSTRHPSTLISHKGDADQLAAIQLIFGVQDIEQPHGLYVPPKAIQPPVSNKKPVGNVMVDKQHPLAKDMIRAMLFQERAGAVTKDHFTGQPCRVDDTVIPWGDAIDLQGTGNAVWLSGNGSNLGVYPEGVIAFRGRATDLTPGGAATLFVTQGGYTKLCIYHGSSNTNLNICAGGNETNHTVTTDLWDGNVHEVAFFWHAPGDWRYLWIDGDFEITASSGTVNDVDLTVGLQLGEAGIDPGGWEYDFCYMYAQWFEGIEKVFRDPYQMFVPDSNF